MRALMRLSSFILILFLVTPVMADVIYYGVNKNPNITKEEIFKLNKEVIKKDYISKSPEDNLYKKTIKPGPEGYIYFIINEDSPKKAIYCQPFNIELTSWTNWVYSFEDKGVKNTVKIFRSDICGEIIHSGNFELK